MKEISKRQSVTNVMNSERASIYAEDNETGCSVSDGGCPTEAAFIERRENRKKKKGSKYNG